MHYLQVGATTIVNKNITAGRELLYQKRNIASIHFTIVGILYKHRSNSYYIKCIINLYFYLQNMFDVIIRKYYL